MEENKELARECFDDYLKEHWHLHASWSSGEEPADYYLGVGPHRLAVQVGVLEGWAATDGPPWFHEEYGPSRDTCPDQKIAARIRTAVVDREMTGAYWMCFTESFPDFKDACDEQIAGEAVQYIQDTQSSLAPLRHGICVRGVEVSRIGKWHTNVDSVQLVELPLLSHLVHRGQRLPEARRAVKKALSDTQRELREPPPPGTSLPTVLLLLDRWPHRGKATYKDCIEASALRDCWHSIFVVEETNKGYSPVDAHKSWWMRVAGISELPHYHSGGAAGSTLI